MFWVKIKTVFNLNFIPQAIKPDVYCWFFKIFYVNTNCSMLQLFVLSYWNSPWWGGEMIISGSAYFTANIPVLQNAAREGEESVAGQLTPDHFRTATLQLVSL